MQILRKQLAVAYFGLAGGKDCLQLVAEGGAFLVCCHKEDKKLGSGNQRTRYTGC